MPDKVAVPFRPAVPLGVRCVTPVAPCAHDRGRLPAPSCWLQLTMLLCCCLQQREGADKCLVHMDPCNSSMGAINGIQADLHLLQLEKQLLGCSSFLL